MKRTTTLLALPLLAGSLTLTACGNDKTTTSSTAAPASSAAASSSAATSGAAAPATTAATDCPTENTKAFAKTRFVTNVGIAAGTFHRWIWTPYKAGTFTKGADGRTSAIVKAGLTAALDAKLINNAYDDVSASPALCKTLKAPLGKLKDTLNGMASGIGKGDLSSIATAEALVGTVEKNSAAAGDPITESTDEKKIVK